MLYQRGTDRDRMMGRDQTFDTAEDQLICLGYLLPFANNFGTPIYVFFWLASLLNCFSTRNTYLDDFWF